MDSLEKTAAAAVNQNRHGAQTELERVAGQNLGLIPGGIYGADSQIAGA
jgi:hypothetical protein